MNAWLLAAALAASPAPQEALPLAPPAIEVPAVEASLPSPDEVMALPPALLDALKTRVIDRTPRGMGRLERLVAFLHDPDGLGIQYRHDADYTVAEVWEKRQANCLSFTLLTIALARAAGFEAYPQEIARTLSWYSDGETLYFSNHVNAGVRIGPHEYTVDVASDSVLSRDPPKRVDDSRLLAVYYSNRAAGLLAQGRHADAARFIDAALAADPRYPSAWNNAGVLRLRQGRSDEAERAFRRALELDRTHDGTLMNMAALYASRGEHATAEIYTRRLERLRQRNPYHAFMQAVEAERRDDYAAAARHYRRAIGMYEEDHRFHYGLARALLHMGDAESAGRELRRARDLSSGQMQANYTAKLDLLRRKGL
jgi:Flp pilus assembly protein TadD